jgi:hypothetical protein
MSGALGIELAKLPFLYSRWPRTETYFTRPTRVPEVLNILPRLSMRATRVPLGVNTLPSRIRYWVEPLASRTNVVGLRLVEPVGNDPVVEQPTSI